MERSDMADDRALEIQHERANPVRGGGGAVPSTGLSQFRGGAKHKEAHEQGAMLAAHLDGLHGSGYSDAFCEGMRKGGARTGRYEGEGKLTITHGGRPAHRDGLSGSGHVVGGGHDVATTRQVVGGGRARLDAVLAKAREMGLEGAGEDIAGAVGSGRRPSKAAMMKMLVSAKKERPDMASAIADRLRQLRGGMTGAGILDDVYKFIMGLFGSKASAPPASKPSAPSSGPSSSAPPSRPSAPAEESAASQLAKYGITDKTSFRKWAAKGGHPDKGGDVPTFQKVSGLAGQLGWSGGKRVKRPVLEGDGRRKRADIVRKVMADKGCSMIEASKYVKEHNLY